MTQYAQISNYPYGFNTTGARCITALGGYGHSPGSLSWPWFCDVDGKGNIFVADTQNDRIKSYQSYTYGLKAGPYGEDNSRSPCCLLRPKSVKRSHIPGTDLLVADTGNQRVALFKLCGNEGQMIHAFSFGADYFSEPTDAACNPATGTVVVVDAGLNRVSIHDRQGSVIALCEQPTFCFKQPSAVAIGNRGTIFVSDTGNHCVRVFASNGHHVKTVGRLGGGIGEFDHPRGVAFDSKGYLYVADEYNSRVQRFSPDLSHVTEVVSNVPLPKGVAADDRLVVTSGDHTNFVKVYFP